MTEFEVTRDGDTVEDAVYDVDPVVDTANPFGDYAVIKLDDRGGNKFAQYERGTRVDVEIIDESGTTFDRFTGYVVERRENEQAGADALEVEAYSFDQFLRRNTVTNDQRGNTIAQALADIIQTDTPVSYVAGNVNVGDDQELTRSYQGEAVENVLRDFAFKSNNEEFGVNDALEFFFRPRETRHIDRGIDNTQWFRYDIPELGKEAINEVEVWFDDGEESVIVDDGTDKLDLQDNLGLPSPGTQRAELNRPLVTDIADAEDIGRKYLKFRNSTLSGTVTTFGLYDAEPGDTIDITIDSRGIDSEFVIAGVEYRWGVDETILTIIERRGDVDDILTDLNDSVQRVEMEGANRDAPSNRITTTNATALVDVETLGPTTTDTDTGTVTDSTTTEYAQDTFVDYDADITVDINDGQTAEISVEVLNDGSVIDSDSDSAIAFGGTITLGASVSAANLTFDAIRFSHSGANTANWEYTVTKQESTAADRFVNDGRRAVRDAWTGDAAPDITTLVVGDDGTGLSRSNDTLRNQTASASVTQALPDATSVEFNASITQTGVQELGLETADGRLITRSVFAAPVDLDGTVTVTLDASNDPSVSRGVLTSDGQTAVRDVLGDNSPALPDAYAYGRDGSAVSESDTALGDELVDVSLEEILIQSANTQSEWGQIVDFNDDDPLILSNDRLEATQIAFTTDSDEFSISGTTLQQDGAYSGGEAEGISVTDDSVSITLDVNHRIPGGDFALYVRLETPGSAGPGLQVAFNGETWKPVIDGASFGTLDWRDLTGTFGGGATAYPGTDIDPGSYDLTITGTSDETSVQAIDVIAPTDDRFSVTLDNDNGGSGGFLDGPELFPNVFEQQFNTASTRRNVTEANFESVWNNTSENQFVELANDGSTFTRFNKSDTGSVTFASPNRDVDTRVGLSRWGSRTDKTPQQGFNGQWIDEWSLFANPDAALTDDIGETLSRAIVPPDTITGETLREAGLKHAATDTLLTRHELAEFTVESSQRISSAESSTFTGDE